MVRTKQKRLAKRKDRLVIKEVNSKGKLRDVNWNVAMIMIIKMIGKAAAWRSEADENMVLLITITR